MSDDIVKRAREAAASAPNRDFLFELADEIERLRAICDFYQQERHFGEAKTFCGAPIGEAVAILARHSEAKAPAQ